MSKSNNIPQIEVPIVHTKSLNNVRHKQQTFTLLLIEKGNTTVNINENKYFLHGPTLVCLNDKESIEFCQSYSLQGETISFNPSFINSNFTTQNIESKKKLRLVSHDMDLFWLNAFMNRTESYVGIIELGTESLRRVKEYLDNINKEITIRDNIYWPCRTRGYFMEFLFFIEHQKSKSLQGNVLILNKSIEKDIEDIIIHINMNYHLHLTLTELCKNFTINRTTLSKKFLKITGYTVGAYINMVRVNMACNMLKETHLPILEIMYNTGFNTTTNFNKTFKNHTGLTPRDYRKKARKGLIN